MAGSFIRAFTRVLAAARSGATAQGQQIRGTTAGTVKDSSGGVLPGMTVRMDGFHTCTPLYRARAHLLSLPLRNNPAGTVPVEGARGSVPASRTSRVGRQAVRTFIGGE